MTILMYTECKQLEECLVWLIFLELRIYHNAKLKLYKFPKTQCIQCTVTIQCTLLHVQVWTWTWKNDKHCYTCTHTECGWPNGWRVWFCPGSPSNKANTVFAKHPHWTKQHVPKQTTHTGLAVAGVTCKLTIVGGHAMQAFPTYKRGIHGVNS